jgi:hypothetical protein
MKLMLPGHCLLAMTAHEVSGPTRVAPCCNLGHIVVGLRRLITSLFELNFPDDAPFLCLVSLEGQLEFSILYVHTQSNTTFNVGI